MAEEARAFKFVRPVEVRFRDLDPMGHVHHSVPLVYFEEARAAYWREVAGQEGLAGIGYVMAEFTVRYHARILFPQTLEVRARVLRLGGKSWSMEYELRSRSGELLVTGESVQVMYDYDAASSAPIPPTIRQRIAKYEGLPSA